MYESRSESPIDRPRFYSRLLWHVSGALGLLALSLAIGISGDMSLEHLSALDAFLNASMLLGGMGPVNLPQTPEGKLFAGCFAL